MIDSIDLSRHAVIGASAGTGKTYTIERLVLRLIVERRVPLREILVVTFTDKATGELRERLRGAIARRLQEPLADEEVRRLLRESLDAFDDAAISTIHAFCHRVLSRFAFENGQPFSSRLVDDGPLRESRLRERMRRHWGSAGRAARLRALLEAGGFPALDGEGESGWERKVCALAAAFRPQGGDRVLPDVPGGDLAAADGAAVAEVRRAVAELLALLAPIDAGDPSAHPFRAGYAKLNINARTRASCVEKVIEPTLRFLATVPACGPSDDEVDAFMAGFDELVHACRSYSRFEKGGFKILGELEFTAKGDNSHVCTDAARVAGLLQRVHAGLAARVASLTVHTVKAVQEDLAAYKRDRGLLSYDDMIARLDEALDPDRNPTAAPLLVAALRRRYRFALVDEFQDTDAVQWRIFRRLFVESKDGHAFAVVGDPKQAIYAFRNADLRAYQGAVSALTGAHGAGTFPLDVNWRSMPDLIEACNALFAHGKWFEVDGDPSGPLECPDVRAPADDDRRTRLYADHSGRAPLTVVELPAASSWRSVNAECLPVYAEFIASEIKRLLGPRPGGGGPTMVISDARRRPVPLSAGHVCVLVQKNADVPRIEKALRRHGVPHTWYKKPGLWQSDEAMHLSYVLRAIAAPGDVAAARKALLTRFFRVPKQDGGFGPIGVERLHEYAGIPPTHAVRRTLLRWQELAQRRDWPCLFRELLQGTGLLLDEALADDADRRIANHVQIAEQLQAEAVTCGLDIHGLVGLIDAYRKEHVEVEEFQGVHRLETTEPRVLILTMHAAKGLEFPVVFVAGGLGDSKRPDFHKYHDADGNVVYDLRGHDMKDLAAAEAEAEVRRLYYVACTRAMYKLYLPYHPPGANGNYWGGSGLKLMSRAADACDGGGAPPSRVSAKDGKPISAAEKPWTPTLDPAPTDHEVRPAAAATPPRVELPPDGELFPEPPGTFHGRVRPITSFTLLSHREPLRQSVSLDDDGADESAAADEGEAAEETSAPVPSVGSAAPAMTWSLPGGTKAGTLVHEILEEVDFAAVAAAETPGDLLREGGTAALIDAKLARHFPAAALDPRVGPAHRQTCAAIVFHALRTRLPEVGRLCDVPPADRLTELEFHFPLAKAPGSGNLDFASLPEGVCLDPAGYVTGKIDLVFRVGGRCWFLDWKTNHLPDGYGPASLEAAMSASQYELQRAIYASAVRRMLGQSERPMPLGGAFYLFLRGVGSPDASGGVHFGDHAAIGRKVE